MGPARRTACKLCPWCRPRSCDLVYFWYIAAVGEVNALRVYPSIAQWQRSGVSYRHDTVYGCKAVNAVSRPGREHPPPNMIARGKSLPQIVAASTLLTGIAGCFLRSTDLQNAVFGSSRRLRKSSGLFSWHRLTLEAWQPCHPSSPTS